MKWDQEIFYNNIQLLIKDRCAGNATIFNEKIHSRDAATRWRTKKPSMKALNTIVDVFDVGIEWLTTGQGEMLKGEGTERNDSTEKRREGSMEGWKLACELLQKENARLEAELLRLTTGDHDRRKSVKA
jgi:hypothetical protein